MSSDTTRTVRRLGWLLGDGRWRVRNVDPEGAVNETTVDLTHAALQARLDVAENRLLGAVTKVDAVLDRTKDRRQRDDLLDIRLRLTGGKQ
jgi:hypothetical protein